MKRQIKKHLRFLYVLALVLPIVVGLSACGSMVGDAPGEGDPELNPPFPIPAPPMKADFILEAEGTLVDGTVLEVEGFVTREGGTISGLDVYVTNATKSSVITAKTIADGTFETNIGAVGGDLIIMVAVDPVTAEQSNVISGRIPIDGGTTIVFTDGNDSDGDGYGDDVDKFPDDPNEWADFDGDGVGDNSDTCPTTAGSDQTDTDGDGDGNICDVDDDDDGVLDGDDNCQYVANLDQLDTDGDGFGDACDTCPGVAGANQKDTDRDGLGDICDPDIDNDGMLNGDEEAVGRNPYVNEPALMVILNLILDD